MLLTRKEVAERLRVSPATVDRYIKRGLIKATKNPGPNGHIRVDEKDLADYIEQHAVEPATEVAS